MKFLKGLFGVLVRFSIVAVLFYASYVGDYSYNNYIFVFYVMIIIMTAFVFAVVIVTYLVCDSPNVKVESINSMIEITAEKVAFKRWIGWLTMIATSIALVSLGFTWLPIFYVLVLIMLKIASSATREGFEEVLLKKTKQEG